MFNEVEIAYWHSINKETDMNDVPRDLFLQKLMMSALLAKEFAEEERKVRIFKAFISHNYPIFMEGY
jgi:hypothetical protein